MRYHIYLSLIILIFSISPVKSQNNTTNINIYIDRDSITLYIPGENRVSLSGLGFEAVIDANRITRFLTDYEQFSLLKWDSIPAPLCLRLERINSTTPEPIECQNLSQKLEHKVNDADVFWFNEATNQIRPISIIGSEQIAFCSQSSCSIIYIAPILPTPESVIPSAPFTNPEFLSPFQQLTNNSEWKPIEIEINDMELVLVPLGCFIMGSEIGDADESPQHQQCIDKPYWIGKYEVTNKQYGSHGFFEGDSHPRENVEWIEADRFCHSIGMRLPTEVEWEFAARGPDNLIYPWGNNFERTFVVHYQLIDGTIRKQTDAVGSTPQGVSWVGAYDMAGNVWEWTSSIYNPYPYKSSVVENDASQTAIRTMRGGDWHGSSVRVRTANRNSGLPITGRDGAGLRCVKDFEPEDWEFLSEE